jgi:hypothetical protein
VDNLIVNSKLATLITNDKNTHAAATIVERVSEAVKQAALVKNRKTLLDITSLGHGNNTTIITDVQDAVLLEDRSDHVLDHNRRAGVADEGRLLVQLLGEEVHTKVAVLAGLSGGGDADDLAGTALEDEQVADADVVAGDGDGVWGADGTGRGVGTLTWGAHGDFAVADDDVFLTLGVVVGVFGVVVTSALEWVENAVGGLVETVAERVVVAVLVVVSHVLLGWAGRGGAVYRDRFLETNGLAFVEAVCWVVAGVGGLVLPVAGRAVLFDERGGAVAEVSLGDVDARVEVDVGGRGMTRGVLAVVVTVLDVDLGVCVPCVGFTVSRWGGGVSVRWYQHGRRKSC